MNALSHVLRKKKVFRTTLTDNKIINIPLIVPKKNYLKIGYIESRKDQGYYFQFYLQQKLHFFPHEKSLPLMCIYHSYQPFIIRTGTCACSEGEFFIQITNRKARVKDGKKHHSKNHVRSKKSLPEQIVVSITCICILFLSESKNHHPPSQIKMLTLWNHWEEN